MKRVRVVAGLIERPGPDGAPLFLAQQRLPGGPRGLLWEFPGGKVEPGEGDAEALVRELSEELGCTVAVEGIVAERVHAYPDLALELILLRCRVLAGEPEPRCAHALTWRSAEALAELAFTEADLPFLTLLREGTRR